MRVRSVLVRAVVAAGLAAGSVGLTAGTAHASSCAIMLSQSRWYSQQADWDWQQAVATGGQEPAQSYYLDQYELDQQWSIIWYDRFNSCNARVP